MNPTERQRIEKAAKEFANPWTPPNSNRRVAVDSYIAGATAEHNLLKPQLEYADNTIKKLHEAMVSAERRGHDKAMEEIKARDESATIEYDKARNQAIQDCIAHVHGYCNATTADTLVKKLESLKTKP